MSQSLPWGKCQIMRVLARIATSCWVSIIDALTICVASIHGTEVIAELSSTPSIHRNCLITWISNEEMQSKHTLYLRVYLPSCEQGVSGNLPLYSFAYPLLRLECYNFGLPHVYPFLRYSWNSSCKYCQTRPTHRWPRDQHLHSSWKVSNIMGGRWHGNGL